MTTQELKKIGFRYVRIRLAGRTEQYENVNFTALLKYIGAYSPRMRENDIGNAYVAIRKETDQLLGVSGLKNRSLKTSKSEVKSIRLSKFWAIESKNNHQYIRIPYKISAIFTAIISLVDKISAEHQIPQDLKDCINKTYEMSFYEFHISKYETLYREKFRDDARQNSHAANPAKLHDELCAPNSVLKSLFVPKT